VFLKNNPYYRGGGVGDVERRGNRGEYVRREANYINGYGF
jgi:hypothetical protein